MKRRWVVSLFLVSLLACSVCFGFGALFNAASGDNSGGSTTMDSAVAIADTNSVYSLQFAHQSIVRLPNGTLCAAFSTDLLGSGDDYAVYVSSSNDNGLTWLLPTKISNATGMDDPGCNQGTYNCAIAADENGNIYVAWTGDVNDSWYFLVWCAIYNGSAWETPQQVSQGSAFGVQAFYLSIATDGNNNVHLVWGAAMDGYACQQIFYAKYNGAWSSPIVISTQQNSDAYDQFYPDIAVDSNNDLHVVWTSDQQVWYAEYDGAWQTPVAISPSMGSGGYSVAPGIAVDSNNNLYVVWNGIQDTSFSQIWYTEYTSSWSTPILISSGSDLGSSDQVWPSIAVSSNNVVQVAWMSSLENAVFYSNFTDSWSAPVQLEPSGSTLPSFRWSFYPSSNAVTSSLDFLFLNGTELTFGSMPQGPPLTSASISPASMQVGAGQEVMLTSNVQGGYLPLSYQWYLNNQAISGATSDSYTFDSTQGGTYNFLLSVMDATGNSIQSEMSQVIVNSTTPTAIFGYPYTSSGAGGSGQQYFAEGTRFTLNSEANITSISCAMEVQSDGQPSYAYTFAIYNDNDGAIGNLVAQTGQGTISFTPSLGSTLQWETLYFSLPVELTPGAYWLTTVYNGENFILIGDVSSATGNVSVGSLIGGLTFPTSVTSTCYYSWGAVYCIYASGDYVTPSSSPTPSPAPTATSSPTSTPTPNSTPTATPNPSSTATPEPTSTPPPASTPSPSPTPITSPTATPTITPFSTPLSTPSPTSTTTRTNKIQATPTPSVTTNPYNPQPKPTSTLTPEQKDNESSFQVQISDFAKIVIITLGIGWILAIAVFTVKRSKNRYGKADSGR